MKGATGISTNGKIFKPKTNRIKCDCRKCVHSQWKGKMFRCKYYDIFETRKTCARYGTW